MKTIRTLLALSLAFGLQGCGGKASVKAPASGGSAAAASAPKASAQPVMTGPDFATSLAPAEVWSLISAVDNWGVWNGKVTKVDAGPGLNVGTQIVYSWEEREIRATLEEVAENQILAWRGARSGKDVLLRWQLRPSGSGTSVSLKAVLKSNAGATPIANAGAETLAWATALNNELSRLAAEAAKKKPGKKGVSKP